MRRRTISSHGLCGQRMCRFNWNLNVCSGITAKGLMEPPLILFSMGRNLVWDFTCPDTLAPSHLAHSSTSAGSAAARAEQLKRFRYSELIRRDDILFVSMAIEDAIFRRSLPVGLDERRTDA